MADKVTGYVLQYEDGDSVGYLDPHLMWKSSAKPTDVRPEDRDVLTPQEVDLARAFIRADRWEGILPQTLYPATWAPEEGVQITGEPIKFTV